MRTKRQFGQIALAILPLHSVRVQDRPNCAQSILELQATEGAKKMTNDLPLGRVSKSKRFFYNGGQFFLCYLAGIIACIIFTPVELMLLDAPMWLFFIPFAPIGYFFFYFDLPPQYVFGSNVSYWSVYVLGITLVSIGFALGVLFKGRLRAWRPLMIGFPIGFVGTLGLYYTAAASI